LADEADQLAFPILQRRQVASIDQDVEAAGLQCGDKPFREGEIAPRIGDEDLEPDVAAVGGDRVMPGRCGGDVLVYGPSCRHGGSASVIAAVKLRSSMIALPALRIARSIAIGTAFTQR
jgi:hypothetical protein